MIPLIIQYYYCCFINEKNNIQTQSLNYCALLAQHCVILAPVETLTGLLCIAIVATNGLDCGHFLDVLRYT